MSRIGAVVLFFALSANAVRVGGIGVWPQEKPNPCFSSPEFIILDSVDITGGAVGCRLIFSNRSQLTTAELTGLRRFLAAGGMLVACGSFGGKHAASAPRDSISPIQELCGCRLVKSGATVHRLWPLAGNPLFGNFHHEQWLKYPGGKAVVLELTDDSAIPLALADFRPAGWQNPGFQVSYFSTRHDSRTAVFAVYRLHGAGLTIHLADDLLGTATTLTPVQEAIFNNILLPQIPAILRQTQARLRQQVIHFADGNLLPNGDFNQIVMAHGVDKIDKNCATGVIAMPCGWAFNSWSGKYSGQAIPRPDAARDYVLQLTGDGADSRGGGATWRCVLDFIRLQPGEKYSLSLRARGQDVVKGECALLVDYHDGTSERFSLTLPTGTFLEQRFNVQLLIDPLRLPRPGATVSVILGGTGIVEIDDMVLSMEME